MMIRQHEYKQPLINLQNTEHNMNDDFINPIPNNNESLKEMVDRANRAEAERDAYEMKYIETQLEQKQKELKDKKTAKGEIVKLINDDPDLRGIAMAAFLNLEKDETQAQKEYDIYSEAYDNIASNDAPKNNNLE